MECVLFGNYARELNAFLESDNKDGAVVVLQFVRVKLYNEKIILQNFMYGTKMFFNPEDPNVIQFKNSFVRFEESKGNIGGIPNETAFLKIYQGKIIEQLKELDTNAVYVVLATISNIMDTSDWCTANANATVIDKEAKQILGKSCVEILDPLLLDVDYTDSLLSISKASSIIEGEKIEGAKNLLLEFSNEVAANNESELLENSITQTKRLFSESEDSKVEGDTSTCKKIKIENET
ncbi:hypothetical protein Ahy_A10g048565 isoform A [Arachis hypogaea]|uniref:Replication factor A C-terminal domain-containing protein n=1 Tax=Arachis hypogaea TaxID=3818 RepID=A0A445B5J3_ARAHY|nr:hypothetical protein Ahy_A10g048565 isoform A [Arachis hypogaea]